ncbi:hypothetical protein BGW36DRAFT_421555 [Talaromyces proteolyticus]|uniref:Mei5 protein n=1 Tax=Talaromyces proteolyticus TaxID=1131652 RepID=A0AAD4L5I8_9EURO|nr:uncharacterized protein BGW36DRAFT_421555 [Talaromyces proteolyticus]KAH8704975.1 hypothetical protein BGW36DRAFT_421555 [Talaromyces proteolyticus]
MDDTVIDLQTDGLQKLRTLVTVVEGLTHDTSFKYASAVVEQDTRLRELVDSQKAEIAKLTDKVKELESVRETTYRELLDVNERERQRYTEAAKEIDLLKLTIATNEETISEQRKEFEALNREYQKLKDSYDKEKKTVTRANENITELQDTLKKKDSSIDKLKAGGSKMKQAHGILQEKYKKLESEKLQMEEEMKVNSGKLDEIGGYAASLNQDKEEALLGKLFSFWENTAEAFSLHMKRNIPNENIRNQQAWKKLRSPGIMSHQIPLPQSNSTAAKQMRYAVFLAILARELVEHIFQPSYIFQSENDIREILGDLAVKDSKKESFCRAILLAIDPERDTLVLEEKKKMVLRNIGSCFLDLFPSLHYEEFRKSLEIVVDRACETWSLFQYSARNYELSFELPEWDGGHWDRLPLGDQEKLDQNKHGNITEDKPVLTVFPSVCRNGSGACKIVEFSTVLTRFQCIDAEQEQKKEPSSPRVARAVSDRQRTRGLSISLANTSNQNGSFLEEKDQLNKQ